MNKKLLISLMLVFGFVGIAKADLRDAWQITEVTAASATVFNGGGRVKAVLLSTAPAGEDRLNWAILLDTPNVMASSLYSSFASSQKKSPAIVFSTYSVTNPDYWKPSGVDYGEDGIFISSAATIYKTTAVSGEAYKVFVIWKK